MGLLPVSGMPSPVMLTSFSRVAQGWDYAFAGLAPGSISTSGSAPRIVPLYVPESVLILKLFWHTAVGPSGNIDVGIYDSNYNLIVSTGSTPMGAASSLVEADITDTRLDRGTYYLGYATSVATTGGLWGMQVASSVMNQIAGAGSMSGVFPLPTTFVPTLSGTTSTPILGASQRPLAA